MALVIFDLQHTTKWRSTLFFVDPVRETIGAGVEEINLDVNPDWLQRDRRASLDLTSKRELNLITSEAEKVQAEKAEKKKSKAEMEFDKKCQENWKKLSENFCCTLHVPTDLLTLPPKYATVRSLQVPVIQAVQGPRMATKCELP